VFFSRCDLVANLHRTKDERNRRTRRFHRRICTTFHEAVTDANARKPCDSLPKLSAHVLFLAWQATIDRSIVTTRGSEGKRQSITMALPLAIARRQSRVFASLVRTRAYHATALQQGGMSPPLPPFARSPRRTEPVRFRFRTRSLLRPGTVRSLLSLLTVSLLRVLF
jgi:hypothetical protein